MPTIIKTNIILFCLFLILLYCEKSVAIWTKFDLVRPWLGSWGSSGRISYIKFGSKFVGLNISSGSLFGSSVANIGDINNDGIDDIAVGAPGESSFVNSTGSKKFCGGIYIIFLNKNASMQSFTHINSSTNGGPLLNYNDKFGYSVSSAGDLDGDSVPDIIVGAPGYAISAVYILFLHRNGTVKNFQLIRGNIRGAVQGPGVIINGPPIHYGSRLGSAVANIGDLNLDGVQDFAVSALDFSSGYCAIFVLFMSRNGTVKSFRTIDSLGQGGGPNLAALQDFPGLGSSIVAIGDLNNDGIVDLAIGANTVYDAGSSNLNAGAVFVCFMARNGTVRSYKRISELSGLPKYSLPLVEGDNCGQSVASIGDINLDNMKQRHPTRLHSPARGSVPDILMGCPESSQGNLNGRLFFVFLSSAGTIEGSTALPASTDAVVGPQLQPKDQFGWALSGYRDVDRNGIREILVGAPGDDESCTDCGAVYLLFPRRRRFHPVPFDAVRFGLLVSIPSFLGLLVIGAGIAYFMWRYRRLPDPIENIVMESGLKIDANRSRKVYVSAASVDDKCYEYTD